MICCSAIQYLLRFKSREEDRDRAIEGKRLRNEKKEQKQQKQQPTNENIMTRTADADEKYQTKMCIV